ncbi:hypothetical protein KSS87_006383, partial [Heliosperma pusillum]
MNARRDANLCLWCDENCVSKEGLKHVAMDQLQDEGEALVNGAKKVFEEMPEPNSCVLNGGTTVSDAHQVFEKIPEPILSSNNDQVAVIGDVDELQPGLNGVPKPYVDGVVPDYVRTAHELFHKTPIPDFILEMANAAKSTHEKNEDMAGTHLMFNTKPEQTEQANASQTISQAAVINNDNSPIQDDHFTHKQQLFPPLNALNASYFKDLVVINANRERFSILHSLISWSCPPLDQTPNEYSEFYNGNSYLEYPYLQVTIKPSLSFAEIEIGVLYKGTLSIDYDDFVWGMISEPICFYQFVFDPGVLLQWVSNYGFFPYSMVFELIMEERANLHYNEVHSWGKLEVELDVLPWMDGLVNTFQPPSSHNFVNFLLSRAIKHKIVRIIALTNYAHTDMVSIHLRTFTSGYSRSKNTDLMIVHYIDIETNVLKIMHHLS